MSVTRDLFDRFRLTLLERRLEVYGVHVWMKNRREAEVRFRADDKVNLHSAAKAVAALAVAFCEEEGRLSLCDKVLDFFPEYKAIAAPGSEEITLLHLMHMQSGKTRGMWFGGRYTERELYERDWAELFFKEPMADKPGTVFSYANQNTYMLLRVVEQVTGERTVDYLNPRLFLPLEIYNPLWRSCPRGHCVGATDLFLRTSELAKIGRLYLLRGEWRGKRLLGESYFDRAVGDIVSTKEACPGDPETEAGYGYQLWLGAEKGTWRIDGKYGQFCIGLPELGAVVTVTAHEERDPYAIVRAVTNDIAPALTWTSGT